MQELFETYYDNSKDTDLKKNEKEFVCNYVNSLAEEDLETLYMLVYHYYLYEGNDANSAYPYNSMKNKLRGIDFNLAKLPYKLRNILFKFCKAMESKEKDEEVEIRVPKQK